MSAWRVAAIAMVFITASVGWMILGGVTIWRTQDQESSLDSRVADLWGTAQEQLPPELQFTWPVIRDEWIERTINGQVVKELRRVNDVDSTFVSADSTNVDASIHSDLRRKGLLWYSLYDVQFRGDWQYVHRQPTPGTLKIKLQFPDAGGIYDDYHFVVNGTDYAATAAPSSGSSIVDLAVAEGDKVNIQVSYKSRGRNQWSYGTRGVGVLRNFRLQLATDFADIDFPANTMSPSHKELVGGGWKLDWQFANVVTGRGIGILTPQRLQPGELVSASSFTAPVSLLFFFVIMFVLATLRRFDLHPMNYLLIAGAFFGFHLLFAYTADRLPIEGAFAIASAVSLTLVVTYLRLVVSPRFAWREAAAAQLVYLVGFALAHFWKGFTGLTVTVLAIITLFVIMQLTAKVQWSAVFASGKRGPGPGPAPSSGTAIELAGAGPTTGTAAR